MGDSLPVQGGRGHGVACRGTWPQCFTPAVPELSSPTADVQFDCPGVMFVGIDVYSGKDVSAIGWANSINSQASKFFAQVDIRSFYLLLIFIT
jgi:hypothetical protein